MIILYIEDARKEVANTVEELRDYFKVMGGKELVKPENLKDPLLVKAVESETQKTLWFLFPAEKMKKLVKTIMPNKDKPKDDDMDDMEEDSFEEDEN